MDRRAFIFYLSPLYWPFWLLLGFLRLLIFLPYAWQIKLGRWIGLRILKYSKKLKHIATVNIQLCFPQLGQAEQENLLKENFIAAGIGLFETLLAFYGSSKKIRALAHFQNLELIPGAQANNRGVLILGAHFIPLEIVGRLYAMDHPIAVVYRAHKKPLINFIISRALKKHFGEVIERHEIRRVLRALKQGKAVWYTPDIDAGYYQHEFIPFFNVPAATLTAPIRLAELTGAKLLLTTYYRRDTNDGYDIIISAPFNDLPSGNMTADLTKINRAIEAMILKHPEQYLWQYKRFKTRPNQEKRLY